MKLYITTIATCLSVVTLSGCGSFTTVTKSNWEISHSLRKSESNCNSIPRIYSGVTYDFCKLNSEPKGGMYNTFLGTWLIADMCLFSPVADTVLLPVTLVQQVKYGNAETSR